MSSPLPVPVGTPHFRRNVHGGIVVVVELVVVVGVHAGSVGSVQEQSVLMQLKRTTLLHALRAMPFKPAQPAAISSEQSFLLHGPVAVATEETKTPAPSATAANVTTALTTRPAGATEHERARFMFGPSLARLTVTPPRRSFCPSIARFEGAGEVGWRRWPAMPGDRAVAVRYDVKGRDARASESGRWPSSASASTRPRS
jgi:hypothetical protein